MDILSSPIVVAIFSLLAIPGITSALAGVLKSAQDATGIPSKVFVYVASLLITGVIVAMSRFQPLQKRYNLHE
jgi:TRAP-type C4-dicarboxylate transport system permease small subunit